jgi:hypothetical protein
MTAGRFDRRILPYSCYVEEENRPYYPDTVIVYRLKVGEDPPDTTKEQGGAAGGTSREGYYLPPIEFPAPTIDTTGGTKVQGADRGQVATGSDSAEDEDGVDDHKLHQLAQAAIKEQQLTIEIRAEYSWAGRLYEAIFSKSNKSVVPLENILDPLELADSEIEAIWKAFQGRGLPHSCIWTSQGLPREEIEITVIKAGEGVHLRYGKRT